MEKAVPLVSIAVLQPFVTALRGAGVDPQDVLAILDFSSEPSAHPDTLVHTNRVNRFLDRCAEVTQDPQFCSRVGSRLDPAGWPMVHTALNQASSLAEFISIYIDGTNRVATSVDTYLELRGGTAAFGQRRITEPDTLPGQNDGFMASLYVAMIRLTCGDVFDPGQVIVTVCDPAALAPDIARCQVLRGNQMGHRVQFPGHWLVRRDMSEIGATPADFHRKDLLSTLRMQLRQNIGTRPLKAPDVAALCGISLSRLKRALARQGTSISAEIDRAKLRYAKTRLTSSTQSIHDIAEVLGYADPANFSRRFRAATGHSPTAWRENATKTNPNAGG